MTVSIIGLGKLGTSMAASFAYKGFNVIGVDVNALSVDLINRRKPPVQETGLADLLADHGERIRATPDFEEAVLGSDVTFVVVPTPSKVDGSFSLEFVRSAFTRIGKALARKNRYHLVVLTSTVLPGSTRFALLPILAAASGKEPGRDFGLCYSPEFIALGSIIRDFLNPDFTLIGELDDRSGSMLESIYGQLVENGARSARMSLENAELTKLSVNTFVTTKIAFANMLASICERLPGGDVDVVSGALGMDSRIGRKYLTGALGYGGPCFPRDNAALSFLARSLSVSAAIAETTDRMNRAVAETWGRKIEKGIPPGSTVAILGLAYKPFSQVTEESQGLQLAEFLASRSFQVLAYDPMSNEMDVDEALDFELAGSIAECVRRADVVIITTPDPEFAKLTENEFGDRSGKLIVYDAWRILPPDLHRSSLIDYRAIGLCRETLSSANWLNELWEEAEIAGVSVGA